MKKWSKTNSKYAKTLQLLEVFVQKLPAPLQRVGSKFLIQTGPNMNEKVSHFTLKFFSTDFLKVCKKLK